MPHTNGRLYKIVCSSIKKCIFGTSKKKKSLFEQLFSVGLAYNIANLVNQASKDSK